MNEYISKQSVLDYLNGYLHSIGEYNLLLDIGQRRALTNAIQDISAIKAADVQPTEKIKEYQSLLEECERKLSYLFECEIESTLESQKVKELIAKIQSSLKDGVQNDD